MKWFKILIARVSGLLRRDTVLGDIEEELRLHIELEAQTNVGKGMALDEARARALKSFGNLGRITDLAYDVRGGGILETLWQDTSHGVRILLNNAGLTLVAIVTLGLGIGAATAIFSVVNSVLLRPLPYPSAERLVMVWERVRLPNYQNERNAPAPGNFADWRKSSSSFREMAAMRSRSFNLTGGQEPVRVSGAAVSASFFSVLETEPLLGRRFTESEDRPDGSRVVVLSHGLWTSRFGRDPQITSKAVLLDDESYDVIGVMPAGFHFPDQEDELWVPLALTPDELADHGRHNLQVVARLQGGVQHQEAQSEMNTIAEALTAQYPNTNTGLGVNLVMLREQFVGDVRPRLLTLLAATGLVLLIVCANLANLLLGRGTARQRELAIRMALGAGRERVFRQLLTECVLLALTGGVLALALAYAGVAALRMLSPPDLPRLEEIGISPSVAAFSLAISVLAAMIFGIAPALQASRQDLQTSLRDGARLSPPGGGVAMRSLLVTVEIALGVVVLAGAGLLLRSFVRLGEVRLGFQTRDVLTQRVIVRGPRYATSSQRGTFYQQAIQRIEALPGVKSAAAVSALPLMNSRNRSGFTIEGSAPPGPGQLPFAVSRTVTPGYFQTMQISLLKGRDLSWQDLPDADRVIVINQAMAGAYWSNADPLGRRIKLGPLDAPLPWLTVVGVVDDVPEFDQITQPPPTMYLPASQSASGAQDLVVRTSQDALSLAAAVRSTIWEIDKDLPVSLVRTMEAVRGGAVSAQRFNVLLMGLFASLALALAITGVYGVTAYSVGQRTREIGVRMALGARPAAVLWLIFGQSVKAIGRGVIIGLGGALVLTPFLRNLLFGVRPTDPVTYAIISLLLVAVAMLACYIPARRATRADPLVALRYD